MIRKNRKRAGIELQMDVMAQLYKYDLTKTEKIDAMAGVIRSICSEKRIKSVKHLLLE
jgi:hypothetical protein